MRAHVSAFQQRRKSVPMTEINKKALSERDICTKYITPALAHAGWDVLAQVREEVAFTAGKVMVKGKTVKRGKALQ